MAATEPTSFEGLSPTAAAGLANEHMRAGLAERLGMEWLEIAADRVVARMPVAGNVQPYGILHGGATAALCETVASVGTAVRVGAEKRVTGIELNINHLRAVTTGSVTATGVPLHVGRTTAVWDMRVTDDGGRLIAASRLTLAIREALPPAP
ncbi:MAG: PaaI family thioesterase [Actinomycetota bacterium]